MVSASAATSRTSVAGAFHVHTNRSDGAGTNLDPTPRTVTIFFDEMHAATPDPTRPVPLATIRGLMFIAHTGNTIPGTGGEVVFSRLAFSR
jgi:hypothetical protein